MLLKIKMEPIANHQVILPIDYNHIIQGFIYDCLNKDLSQFLHEKGFKYHSRSFKMFTFSRLMGEYKLNKDRGQIVFTGPMYLVITSPVKGFFNSLAHTFLIGNIVRLGNNNLKITSLEGEHIDVESEEIIVRTLSPIVVYSTLLRPDNRKYTCYFQPGDPDYNRLITENLKKKYISFLKTEPPQGSITVKTLSPCKQVIVNYKKTIIKGYTGKIKITGPRELLKIALEAGCGSKNAQGFGLIQLKEQSNTLFFKDLLFKSI
ncbi:CRISPR-associated protein Cas6 [Clostridium aceticum]|uniref:CRISPR-associated endoribonuclease n=1 Tax=Clostridium aceticum TaxID=84022 RepID=A0A0G3W7C0_9CLOT|nr:CRISPR-associated endoribonuclease Cas6 [Clostridium aceticum]AKL94551.1 CRISPR-associated protein Cas6 [Clostridium aceticum]